MVLVIGLVLVIAAGAAIGMLLARRPHNVHGYYERKEKDLPTIGSSYPTGLD
jgi:uncharacterized protein YneF (UPF0154 family)